MLQGVNYYPSFIMDLFEAYPCKLYLLAQSATLNTVGRMETC